MTESNEAGGRKKGSPAAPQGSAGREGCGQNSGEDPKKSLSMTGSDDGVTSSDLGDSCDEFPLDEDPRVAIGLNRFIEAVVKASDQNSRDLFTDDD